MQGTPRVIRIVFLVNYPELTSELPQLALIIILAEAGQEGMVSEINKSKQHSSQVSKVSNIIGRTRQRGIKLNRSKNHDKVLGLNRE